MRPISQTIQSHITSSTIEVQHVQRPRKTLPPSKTFEDESSAGESGDEYVQDSAPSKIKRRTKRREDDDDDSRRPVQRKRKRKALVEQDLSELPPEQGEHSASPVQVDGSRLLSRPRCLPKVPAQ